MTDSSFDYVGENEPRDEPEYTLGWYPKLLEPTIRFQEDSPNEDAWLEIDADHTLDMETGRWA